MISARLTTVAPLVMIGLVAVFLVVWYTRSAMRHKDASEWPSTTGIVVSSTVQVKRVAGQTRKIPAVIYQYMVGGHPYQGFRVKAGESLGNMRFAGGAECTVQKYPTGAEVVVYFDPDNPGEAALER